MKMYIYKANSYNNLYDLAEVLGGDGVFIPLSISDADLEALGVTVTHKEEPLENVKQRKIIDFKYRRDTAEVEPITYNGNSYDYDDKARDRINAAIIALSLQGEGASIDWTTANNADVKVTANDLRKIIANVAIRSNKLHTVYRLAKEKVELAKTKEEVDKITLEL